jgi:solute carrier family 25 (mitochondrial phosphate transporter), member 23/24/25/41
MYNKEGVKGLFRGNGVNIVIQAPFTALEFYFYEVFKNNLYNVDRS